MAINPNFVFEEIFDGDSGESTETPTVELDTTLKVEGKAADAKAVGDALDELNDRVDNLPSGSTVIIDTTLTQPNQAADAATVGARLTSQAGEHAAMNMRILALEQGGGGGSTGGGGSVALDTTLTQAGKAADAKAVGDAINALYTGAEIWAVFTNGDEEIVRFNYADQAAEMGAALNVELVDTLPETLTPTSLSGGDMYFYVIKSTGVPYINADGLEVLSFGYLIAEDESFNRGWTTDINAETEIGVYCVRTMAKSDNGRVVLTINLADLFANGNVQIPDNDVQRLKGNFANSAIKMISDTGMVVLNPAECYTDKIYYSTIGKTDVGYSLTVGWLQYDGSAWGFTFINKPILDQ